MNLAFDEAKATQTAAAFLRLAGGQLHPLALLKLLYQADREALRRWGLPITTDRYASMQFGPVTSRIHGFIKASSGPGARPTFWSRHIGQRGPDTVSLTADPGDSEMSRAENRLIAEIFAGEATHCVYPEWKDPGVATSTPIEVSEILAALDVSEEEACHTYSAITAQRAARGLAI